MYRMKKEYITISFSYYNFLIIYIVLFIYIIYILYLYIIYIILIIYNKAFMNLHIYTIFSFLFLFIGYVNTV